MSWLKELGWLVAVVLAVILLTGWLPKQKQQQFPDPQESRAAFEKLRAEFDAKQAMREEVVANARTEGTLDLLRLVGRSYTRRLAQAKTPPQEEDVAEVRDYWRSRRDEKPFVILWGVDLTRLPDGGSGMLLAWEQTADDTGCRCVLMADGKSVKVVNSDEFEKLPRAK
jgi:hypothetical protein